MIEVNRVGIDVIEQGLLGLETKGHCKTTTKGLDESLMLMGLPQLPQAGY